jgi:hypothetical protein
MAQQQTISDAQKAARLRGLSNVGTGFSKSVSHNLSYPMQTPGQQPFFYNQFIHGARTPGTNKIFGDRGGPAAVGRHMGLQDLAYKSMMDPYGAEGRLSPLQRSMMGMTGGGAVDYSGMVKKLMKSVSGKGMLKKKDLKVDDLMTDLDEERMREREYGGVKQNVEAGMADAMRGAMQNYRSRGLNYMLPQAMAGVQQKAAGDKGRGWREASSRASGLRLSAKEKTAQLNAMMKELFVKQKLGLLDAKTRMATAAMRLIPSQQGQMSGNFGGMSMSMPFMPGGSQVFGTQY